MSRKRNEQQCFYAGSFRLLLGVTMTCMLCGQPIDGTAPSVPTTDGQQVHIACADHSARVASRTRALRATITALAIAGLLLIVALLWPLALVVLLIPCGLLLHMTLNRCWWRLRTQSTHLWAWRTRHSRWRPWRRPRH